MLVSITTPTFNEEGNIQKLFDTIGAIFKDSKYTFEHIVVDNRSTDRTVEFAKQYADKYLYPLRMLVNNENYGPDYSPMVAFRVAEGDVVIPIVADMQDPPELIPLMLSKYAENSNIDLICCINMEHTTNRERFSKFLYATLNLLKAESIDSFQGYGLYSRELVRKIANDPYRYFYFRGLVAKFAKNKIYLDYKKKERLEGKSYYSHFRLIKNILVAFNFLFPNFLFYISIILSFILILINTNTVFVLIIWILLYLIKNFFLGIILLLLYTS